MKYHIENMTCGGCARSVTKAIETADPSATVITDVAARTVEIRSVKSEHSITKALGAAGYAPTELETQLY